MIVGVALGLGAAGLLGGFAMARRAQGPTALVATAPPSPPAFVPLAANFPLPPLPVVPVGPPPTPVVAGSVSRPPAVPSPPVVVAPPPPAPVPALLPVAAAAPPVPTPPSPPRAAPRDGFSDPEDGARMSGSGRTSTVMSVQGHNVRLFTRLVSNASNVADGVVRGAVDWSSWEYIRCYQRTFGGAKDLPEGTVRLSFDIMDQLPRHATLEASTFTSAEVAQCVVQTLAGHTMNAARSVGAGHVVYAFKFVVVD